MVSFRNAELDQGCSFTRPPLFRGYNFAYWKKLMQVFIKDHDYEHWEILSEGNFMPIRKEGDRIFPKPRSMFTYEKTEKVAKNIEL